MAAGFGTLFAWVPGFGLNAGILIFGALSVWTGIKEVVASAE